MTDNDEFVNVVECTCVDENDKCEACESDDESRGFSDSVHATLDQASRDVRNALTSGLAAAEPVFRNKVAPALAQASAKLSDMSTNAQKSTAERAGLADDTAPSEQIGHGLAAIASGLLGLSRSLADWVHEHASAAAEAEGKVETVDVVTEPVSEDVGDIADILQTPVVVFDGDTEAVEPN
jgi:hypothetical protein